MKWRIWLLSLGITFVCVLIFGIASAQVYYNSSIVDSRRYLSVYMNGFSETYFQNPADGAREFSEILGGARVTFMDAGGAVLADSGAADGVTMENHSGREEVRDAISDGEGFSVRGSSTLGKNMAYYCRKTPQGNLVRIAVFVDSDWSIFLSALPTYATFSAIMIALCIVLAVVATHFIVSPVKKLAQSAAENETVKSKYSELQPVAAILNKRNLDVRRQMDEIKAERELALRAQISKDEFISNVTHEMNTPLTSICGYAELLNDGALKGEQLSAAYKTLLSQSERLSGLIAGIINYSKIDGDAQPPYEVDVSEIARETICALKPEADRRNIKIIENIDEGVTVLSRNEAVGEVFGNLVRNALKYNKDGGSVAVTVNSEGIIVEDTGIGISNENLDKVFSRFFTVDKSCGGKNGGFGLGLAVVKKICQKSGWKISLESKLGEGSKFSVRFI